MAREDTMMKEAGMRPSDPCPVATTVFPQNPNCDEFFGHPRPGNNMMTDHLGALESPKLGRRTRYRNAAGDKRLPIAKASSSSPQPA
jgi:hypothetical protein